MKQQIKTKVDVISKSKVGGGKHLVIVESPAKAKTISGFLGKDFRVEASIGHVRDLPRSADEIPAQFKSEKWARTGVDVDNGFKPLYIVPAEKKKQVKRLKDALKDADELYLATDEDLEGESISWHLLEILKPKVKVKRLVFHEITKEAIQESLKNPRDIDMNMVHAQETRRVLDRLYGYEVSPLLWRKVAPRLSAGRVQSVAIRLVVERERIRQKFVSSMYFDLESLFEKKSGGVFSAVLKSIDGKRVATGKDFDDETGKLKNEKTVWLKEEEAKDLVESVKKSNFKVLEVEEKPYKRSPYPPFITSTLQQEAARKLRFSAKKTMQVAQKLYENGFITYMRTDSINLSDSAIKSARTQAANEFGKESVTEIPRSFKKTVKNAQEAHEAIRPAGSVFKKPSELKNQLEHDHFALYDLIWKRTLAAQMKDAEMVGTHVKIGDGKFEFGASGNRIEFAGFLKAYNISEEEEDDDDDENLKDEVQKLPKLNVGEEVELKNVEEKKHETKPVARYTEASLIKELEAKGIGRPSTYATIMDTIVRREYVVKKGTALVPTFVAFAVVKLMENYFAHLVDYDFTAEMEDDLDEISMGKKLHEPYLKKFYFGEGKSGEGLKMLIDQEIDAREVCTISKWGTDSGKEIRLRVGKYGPFLESSENEKASIPDEISPDELNLEKAIEILATKKEEGEGGELGVDPVSGKKIYKAIGRFGPFVQMGEKGEKDTRYKSIPKEVSFGEVDLEKALMLLSLPRLLGKNDQGDEVFVELGRYGAYLKIAGKNVALTENVDVFSVGLEEAISKIKVGGGRARGGKILKTLGEIKVMDGKYGMYVTDGKNNVSVPKGVALDEVDEKLADELMKNKVSEKSKDKVKKRVKKAVKKKE